MEYSQGVAISHPLYANLIMNFALFSCVTLDVELPPSLASDISLHLSSASDITFIPCLMPIIAPLPDSARTSLYLPASLRISFCFPALHETWFVPFAFDPLGSAQFLPRPQRSVLLPLIKECLASFLFASSSVSLPSLAPLCLSRLGFRLQADQQARAILCWVQEGRELLLRGVSVTSVPGGTFKTDFD